MATSRTVKKAVTLFGVLTTFVLFGLPLFFGLTSQDLNNDEAIYSYAVDRMLEGESWLTPRSSPQTVYPGDPGTHAGVFFEKPPLKFWIVALPIQLGLLPHDEFGLRFWDALFGAVAFLYVFLIGRRLVDPLCGLAAVFLLFINGALLFEHGLRSTVMEAPLFLAYTGGIYHFLAWSESDRRSDRWRHIIAFAGWFTLGFMTKFVAAIFLPMVVGVTALCLPDWRRRLRADRWRWIAGALSSTALILPWFVYQYADNGAYFWNVIFGAHIYDRVRGTLHPDHARPWSFYFTRLHAHLTQVGALGWVIAGGALWITQSVRRPWNGGVLIVVWFLLPVGIISLSVAKLGWYMYPFLPPVALVGGYAVSRVVQLARRLHAGSGGVLHLVERAGLGSRSKRHSRPDDHDPSTLSRTARHAAFAGTLALVVYLWPVAQYAATFDALDDHRRPLSALRHCLVEQFDELTLVAPDTVSRMYIHLPEGQGLTHNYYCYYRVLGQWERLVSPTDADLYRRLFVPGHRAPTLMFGRDLQAFLQRIGSPDFGVALRALGAEIGDPALMATESGELLPAATAVRLGRAGTTAAVVVLPGPLAGCADELLAEGGTLVENMPGPWRAAFHSTQDLTGQPVAVKQYPSLDFDWGEQTLPPGLPIDNFSVRIDTCVTLEAATATTFRLSSDDGSRLFIDDIAVIDHRGRHPFSTKEGVFALRPGVHHVEVQYTVLERGARLRLRDDAGLLSEDRLVPPGGDPTRPCENRPASAAQLPL